VDGRASVICTQSLILIVVGGAVDGEFGRWLRLGRRSTARGRGEDELPAPLMTARDGGADEASRRLVAASPLGAISRSRVAGDGDMSSNHDHRVSELA